MEGYITFSQMGLIIVFLIVVVVGIYAITTLRNVNSAVKDIGEILKENKGSLNKAIPNIITASENVSAIINDFRVNPVDIRKALVTADPITTYAVVIAETAKAIANLLTTIRK